MLYPMTRVFSRILIALVLVGFGFSSSEGQGGSDDPEAVIRQLVQAIYSVDIEAYNRLTTDHPLRSLLTVGGSPNPEGLRRLKQDPESLQIRAMRPTVHQGKPVETAPDPIGATALYAVAHQNQPMLVPMVRRPDGWKVDVRWWISMQQMSMSSVPPPPEHLTIRSLITAMLSLDRAEAARSLTDPRGIDLLWVGSPSSREPSGVLEEIALEMPLVEVGAGEFYMLPSGRIVEGGSTESRKVIVGLFGPIEMPFVVARVGNGWRVEAEPYFILMLQ